MTAVIGELEAVAAPFAAPTRRELEEAYRINADFDTISAVQAGDTEAFGDIHRRYWQPLNRYLGNLCNGDYARAEDLAQETFIKAYKYIDNVSDKSRGASPWLYTIARNVLIDSTRRGCWKHEEAAEDPAGPMPLATSDHADTLASRLDMEQLLREVHPSRRKTAYLIYYLGMTNTDAAEILELPRGTINSQLSRVRKDLEAKLKTYRLAG